MEDNDIETKVEDKFGVFYMCLRCGTITSHEEINRLPEIKCICGYRVFVKKRPPLVKKVNAI